MRSNPFPWNDIKDRPDICCQAMAFADHRRKIGQYLGVYLRACFICSAAGAVHCSSGHCHQSGSSSASASEVAVAGDGRILWCRNNHTTSHRSTGRNRHGSARHLVTQHLVIRQLITQQICLKATAESSKTMREK